MVEIQYNPQFPPLISLCVSSLVGRGFAKCIPNQNLAGALVVTGGLRGGAQRELMTDVACAKTLAQLSLPTLPLYSGSAGVSTFPADTAGGRAAAETAGAEQLTRIDAMISLALAIQASGGAGDGQLLSGLSSQLQLRTFLAARHLTLADLAVYTALRRMLNAGQATAGTTGQPQTPLAAGNLGAKPQCGAPALWEKKYPHLARWFAFIDGQGRLAGCVTEALRKADLYKQQKLQQQQKLSSASSKSSSSTSEGGADRKIKDAGQHASYEGKLEGAQMGEVVTRFPPEPSGYLHIGHAKAALLNDYFAKKYKGKMLFRFDDTNPAKEKEEYEESIREDLKLLHVDWAAVSHSSDYFEQMQNLCERLIREGRLLEIYSGKFYVDDTPTEVMREQRGQGTESCRRNDSIEENLKRWKEMLSGSPAGAQCCVRARIDMQSKNKCMRDPVMYRCIPDIPHHRCGTKFKIYPTYDFACPVIDALEGVTHALRTNEYADRIPQYHWVQEAAGLRQVHVYEFSRLCFVRTLLSKRKLKYFVDNKLVDGWDDPRMPTVRGILRRGLQVEALLEFMLEQGASKAGNLMEWDKLWTINKQQLDPIVPRYMAVGSDAVPVHIKGAPHTPECKSRRLHVKNESLGDANMWFCDRVLIDRDDAALCVDGEEVTLMHIGNCIFDRIIKCEQDGHIVRIEATLHLEGDFKKTKKKLHWVPDLAACPPPTTCTPGPKNSTVVLREFDHLITADKIEGEQEEDWEQYINKQTVFDTPAIGDPLLQTLKEGSLLQLERRGYFRVDQTGEQKTVLIKIPDGKSKAMSVVSSKVDAAKLSGTKKAAKK